MVKPYSATWEVSAEQGRHPKAMVSVVSLTVRFVSVSDSLCPNHLATDSKSSSFRNRSVRIVKELQVVDAVSGCLQPRPHSRVHQAIDRLALLTAPGLRLAQVVVEVAEAHSMAVEAQLLPILTFDYRFRTGPARYFVDLDMDSSLYSALMALAMLFLVRIAFVLEYLDDVQKEGHC